MFPTETMRNLRIKKNLTQKQVAKSIGVRDSTYACYENGQRIPSIDRLIQISDVLETSLDELVCHDTPERVIIAKYRALDERDKRLLEGMLTLMAEHRQPEIQKSENLIPVRRASRNNQKTPETAYITEEEYQNIKNMEDMDDNL